MKIKRTAFPKRINKTLKHVAKLNLLTVLNENVAKPIQRFIRDEIADLQRNKIKAEYHFCPNYTLAKEAKTKGKSKKLKTVKRIVFSSKEYSPDKPTLRDQLKEFTMKHNPSNELVSDLLTIMKDSGVKVSPKTDAMCHNRSEFEILSMTTGRYINFGVKRSIISFIRKLSDQTNYACTKTLFMDLAFYVVKSEKVKGVQLPQYMIILGKLSLQLDEPFVIGIYQGIFPTPTIANEILRPLVDELKALQHIELQLDERSFGVRVRNVLCDPIANSLVTCTSLPNSQFGCSKCNQMGQLQFNEGITSFPPTANLASMRTDEDFIYCLQNGHHVGAPILLELNLELKSKFVIDYKYVVCEGVMKRMMNLWLAGKLDYRLNKESIRRISGELRDLAKCCPREFKQKPKGLDELEQWDAYDWRQFLLYYSPIVLKNYLPQKYYIHFLYLHLAIRMLVSSEPFVECSTYVSGQLLNTFVADYSILYGSHLIDYNVHNLLHFEEINMKAGPMCHTNGYLYDRQMDTIMKAIQSSSKISLDEIGALVRDNTNVIVENKLNECRQRYPQVEQSNEGPVLLLNSNTTLTTREPDNYVITEAGVMMIEGIYPEDSELPEIVLVGRQYMDVTVLYQTPVTVQKLLLVSKLSPVFAFKVSEVQVKAIKADTPRGTCVLPLID
ncbi:uncharacterized protein LOC129776545 [Toxorhynchites rutilus septentrionalis]|uniref:uncharacterized protein LOC129776545 n=1 Tax=Toxorhynchites rutilus septentrionalis TaxID=329112 RepID=UPI00247AC9AC|nr:uncharacterized protein LOC129776545 [Toxorhynchites rutilus septentrionalis]